MSLRELILVVLGIKGFNFFPFPPAHVIFVYFIAGGEVYQIVGFGVPQNPGVSCLIGNEFHTQK